MALSLLRVRIASIVTLVLMVSHSLVYSQPTYVDSLRPMYGIPSTEFFRGGWIDPYYTRRSTSATSGITTDGQAEGNIWQYCDLLGISTIRYKFLDGGLSAQIGSLETYRSQMPDPGQFKLIISNPVIDIQDDGLPGWYSYAYAGFSQQVVFYPFAAARFPEWVNKFLWIDGGTTRENLISSDSHMNDIRRERVLSFANGDTAGQLIAKGVVYDWRSEQTNRLPSNSVNPRTVQDVDWPFQNVRHNAGITQW